MDLTKLAVPFAPEDIEWRVQQSSTAADKPWAMVLAYVTNRAVMERLDDVCGPENWSNQFKESPDGGVLCGVSILTYYTSNNNNYRDWVTKWDGAENTQVEAVKGGLSGAMKRAAVQWGIGRYLYNLDTNFVSLVNVKPGDMKGWNSIWDKETKKRWYWKIPTLPKWALPVSAVDSKNETN